MQELKNAKHPFHIPPKAQIKIHAKNRGNENSGKKSHETNGNP